MTVAVPAMLAVEFDRGADVDVGDAVAVGQAEGLVVVEILQRTRLMRPPVMRVVAGVDQRDLPRLGVRCDGLRSFVARGRA